MKIYVKSYTEPSSREYGQAMDEIRRRRQDKYYPFDVQPWYDSGYSTSVESNGYEITLETNSGDRFQWIAQRSSDTLLWNRPVRLYGPFDNNAGEHCERLSQLFGQYKDKFIGEFNNKQNPLAPVMDYLFNVCDDILDS